jgi:hypothetical protein
MTEHDQQERHIPFDELNDYVDGRLDQTQAVELTSHLSACSACAREHDDLLSLLRVAGSISREVLPPSTVWADVKATIDRRKEVVLPTGARTDPMPTRRDGDASSPWRRRAFLGAAALVLITASSAITAIVLRIGGGSTSIAAGTGVDAPESQKTATAVLPVAFRLAENGYIRTIDELHSALDAQRADLKPETVAAVERSLAVVDSAIAEARSALLDDPSNRTLVDLLSASYQRKLDLLQQASGLDRRT